MKTYWQRLAIITLMGLAVILFAFFLYWFFWRAFFAPPEITPPVTTTTPGQLTGAGEAGVRPISTSTLGQLIEATSTPTTITTEISEVANGGLTRTEAFVKDPTLFSAMTSGGQINYLNTKDGKFYRIGADGQAVALSDQTFFGASSVFWDGAGDRATIEFRDGSNIVYDFATKKQVVLPAHWEDLKITSNGDSIAFKNMAYDVENRYLAVSKFDGSQPKIIESIGANADKVQINWSPNNQVVAQYVEGKDSSRSEVYFVGQNKENFRSMVVQGRGFEGKWSPSGNYMLYSTYDVNDNYRPSLWISAASGENIGASRNPIAIKTFVDKCTFAEDRFVICGAPEEMPAGAGLNRSEADKVQDNIWLIDLATGNTRMIAKPQGARTVENIMYSSSNPGKIFFSEKNDNRIYQINLP
ncbi:MAG: hypothetical protein BWY53_00698 [Parcubacteria group bacterium ADurb.Bin326]|nr:MAG: hypothetical protein BWY53_00698 [Parcubacteria group bacterium ADurb.Bin326]